MVERVEGVQPHLEAPCQADGGAGLGTAWGEQKALAMLGEVAFSRVEVLRLADDPLNNYYLARKA